MFNGPKPNEIEDWVCIMEGSTNYEVEFAKNYLANLEIPSNILSKRDSAYSLTVGEMALVYLYVPKEYEKKALLALEEVKIPDNLDNEEE